MKQCSKCGNELKPKLEEDHFKNNYCKKCLDRFYEIEDKGAIIIRRRLGRDDTIIRWDVYHNGYGLSYNPDGINQIQAIKKGREWGRKYNLPIIFKYEPHQSIWFLDDYLKAHPKINNDVEKAEKTIIEKIFFKCKCKK